MAKADSIFHEKDFNTQTLTCDNCGWKGSGADTKVLDLYGLASYKQVNCPVCDNSLGSLTKNGGANGDLPDELSNQIG